MSHDHIRKSIYKKCGIVEHKIDTTIHTVSSFRNSQWSFRFQRLMQNRLCFGAARYGLNFVGDPKKDRIDRISHMKHLINKYDKTGNDELLVDLANFAMMEFEEGVHPNKHFESIDDGKHAEIK